MSAPRHEILAEGVELWCGDCREIIEGIGGFDVLATDPPYGMAFRSNHRRVKHSAIANDTTTNLLRWACSLKPRHSAYIFCRWDNLPDVPKPRSLVTWVKNNWSMGDLNHEHARQTEVALFYPGPQHFFPNGRPQDVIIAPRTGNENHPTEKPVQLMRAVLEWTDGLVVDPFMGSGSTGVAAVALGRPFVGVEIDEAHFSTACRRIDDALSRPQFFSAPAPRPVQEPLL